MVLNIGFSEEDNGPRFQGQWVGVFSFQGQWVSVFGNDELEFG